MRLLVLGASGRCGQWLVRLAVKRGHDVTAVVRDQTPFAPSSSVQVHRGQVTEPGVLDRVLPGHDAVLSTLGLRRAGLSPWAPLRSPPDLTTRVAELLVAAMPRRRLRRLVALSAGGVGDSAQQLTWMVRRVVSLANVGVAYQDLEAMEEILAGGVLDWCVGRPVTLINGPPRKSARPVERYRMTSFVRRSEVAAWMLDVVESRSPFTDRHVLLGR